MSDKKKNLRMAAPRSRNEDLRPVNSAMDFNSHRSSTAASGALFLTEAKISCSKVPAGSPLTGYTRDLRSPRRAGRTTEQEHKKGGRTGPGMQLPQISPPSREVFVRLFENKGAHRKKTGWGEPTEQDSQKYREVFSNTTIKKEIDEVFATKDPTFIDTYLRQAEAMKGVKDNIRYLKNSINENRKHLCDLQFLVKQREKELALKRVVLQDEQLKKSDPTEMQADKLKRLELEAEERGRMADAELLNTKTYRHMTARTKA